MQIEVSQSCSVHAQTFPVSWHVSHRCGGGNDQLQVVVDREGVDRAYFHGLEGARILCVIEQVVLLQGAAKISEQCSPCNHWAVSGMMNTGGETYSMPLYA